MRVQFFSFDGREVAFHEIEGKKYLGILLPGAEVRQSFSKAASLTIQELETPLFTIGYRLLKIFSKTKFTVKEKAIFRLEAVLSGEMEVSVNGKKIKFRAGEYRLTDVPLFTALLKKNSSCSIFITHYSAEILRQSGIEFAPSPPQRMPGIMANLINEVLHNPYTEKLRDFYYENSVRELLFFHLAQREISLPGELLNKDISLIYKADSIISSNLRQHYTIDELSRLSGTNKLKLKKGFRQLFGMGLFRRLLFRRMEQAKLLLETTDKSIGEIARLAGYDTAAGFIHAFRREFGLTPREWRNQEKD